MNKKNVSQIKLYLDGLISRMMDNTAYFVNIHILFRSGTKEFAGIISCDDDEVFFSFQAVKNRVEVGELADIVCNEISKYDAAVITYNERGTQIIVEADEKKVKMQHKQADTQVSENVGQVSAKREYLVNPALAKDLLEEIGILAKNGKIKNDKIRKYNQIDYFVELMRDLIADIPADKEIVIMDCACGKSYLSFVMNFYFCEIAKRKCRFIGVDYSDVVIDASNRIADNLGYKNMKFIQADLREYTPDEEIDVVISLHACDVATDMALALGIRAKAKAIVCVPCCHKDVLAQYSYEPFKAITKYGILKARLADTLTDGIRAAYLESVGYRVSMLEYISPLETPKNIMIRAVYSGKINSEAKDEYENLKTMLNVKPAIERFLKEYNER